MMISYFCGVVSSACTGVESGTKEEGARHFCELGSYRLALRGQSSGTHAGDQGILFDGGIFNAIELAGRLGTVPMEEHELLLLAYRKWGVEFPRYLDGEFAFVLWDRVEGRVLLGCEPGGSIPLFYAHRGEDFFFARTPHDLLTMMGTTPRINEGYLASWLAMTFSGSDSTFFEDVFRVIPGSVVAFERGRVTQHLYWQPEKISTLHLRNSGEYGDALREVLTRAIRDRLPVRSKAGTLLSGGMDSSTVTSLAAEMLHRENRRLCAFTAVPAHPVGDRKGRFCDEGPAAASVAAMWPNVDHVLVHHGHHSVFSLMDLFGSAQMEPVVNPANYDWFYEAGLQARQRHLDVMLTGDYGNIGMSYGDWLVLRSLASEGRWMVAARLAREMHRNGRRRWRGIVYELLSLWIPLEARFLIQRVLGTSYDLFEYSMIRREFARHHGLNSLVLERIIEHRHSRPMRILLYCRPDIGAVNDAFRKLTGVSKFDPTADRRVIEFCLSVPVEYYCEKGVPRSLIRNAMVGRLPEQVRTERRRGLQSADFAIHFEREREEALAELARMKKVDLVAKAINIEVLEQMMQWSRDQIEAHGGTIRYWPKVLRAFSVGRFLRRFEDRTLFSLAGD